MYIEIGLCVCMFVVVVVVVGREVHDDLFLFSDDAGRKVRALGHSHLHACCL